MTEDTARKVVILLIIGMLVQLLVVGYVFYAGYDGRRNTVNAQRGGCARSKLDRSANAAGWRNAEAARRAEGQVDVAEKYAKIARGLERRSRVNCAKAFPKARLFE